MGVGSWSLELWPGPRGLREQRQSGECLWAGSSFEFELQLKFELEPELASAEPGDLSSLGVKLKAASCSR